MMPPIYPPDAVQPFRDELNVVGLKDLLETDQPLALRARILHALAGKPAGHRLHENNSGDTRQLAQFGG